MHAHIKAGSQYDAIKRSRFQSAMQESILTLNAGDAPSYIKSQEEGLSIPFYISGKKQVKAFNNSSAMAKRAREPEQTQLTQVTTADTQGTFESTLKDAYESIGDAHLRITHTTIEEAKEHCVKIIDGYLNQNPVTKFYIGKTHYDGLNSRWNDAIMLRQKKYNKLFVIAVIEKEWVDPAMIDDVNAQPEFSNRSVYDKCALLLENKLIKHYKTDKRLDNESEWPGNKCTTEPPAYLVYLCVRYSNIPPITPASEQRNKNQLKAKTVLFKAGKAINKAVTAAQKEMTEAMTEAMTEEQKQMNEAMTVVQKAMAKAMTEDMTEEMTEEMIEEITERTQQMLVFDETNED